MRPLLSMAKNGDVRLYVTAPKRKRSRSMALTAFTNTPPPAFSGMLQKGEVR
jgi:hypothetical protein